MTTMNPNDATDPATNSPAGAPAGDAELAALRNERDQLQEQLKRSLADIANVRRRHSKEMEQVRSAAIEALAGELLPVLDNFHLALESQDAVDSHSQSLLQGVRMVRSLLEGALERHGLREMKCSGEPFNPSLHEAVGLDTAADVAPGHVARVLQRGYYLGEKLLRPSRVLVRDQNKPAENSDKPV